MAWEWALRLSLPAHPPSQISPTWAVDGAGLSMPATRAPHTLPVIRVLPQSGLIGIIGSWLGQAGCEVPCSLLKFILCILVGRKTEFSSPTIWGGDERGLLLRV